MDNASEALRIAGAVLIGVMLLALLIAFYNNISDYSKVKANENYIDQVGNFNKQFDMYMREIYGSDLLSVANKVADYNVQEVDNKGYIRLEIKVKFKSNYGILQDASNTILFEKDETYTTDQIIGNMNTLEKKIKDIGNLTFGGKKIKELASMRENEFWDFIDNNNITQGAKVKKYRYLYTTLKADETTIKSKIFKYINSTYDNTVGRVTMIEYEEM